MRPQGRKPGGRLEASGCFNAMVSDRVRVTDVPDADEELAGWMRQAHEGS